MMDRFRLIADFFIGPDAQASVAKYLARYPLTGPSKLKVVLEKNDLRGYHIKGIFRNDPEQRIFEILFDAEGMIFELLYLFCFNGSLKSVW